MTCSTCRSCTPSDNPDQGLCRCLPPELFREVETVQAEGSPPGITIRLHSHYRPVGLADPGCREWRPHRGPLGRTIIAAWRLLQAV